MEAWTPSEGTLGIENQLGDWTPEPPTGPLYLTGMVIPYTRYVAPDGWLACNGSLKLIAEFGDLFALIGHSFDISGTNPNPTIYFQVPDMRGRGAQTTSTLAEYGGASQVVLSANMLPAHGHATNLPNGALNELYGGAFPSFPVSSTIQNVATSAPMKDKDGNVVSDPPDPIPIINPFIILSYIIKI